MFIYYIEEDLTAGMTQGLKYIDGENKETNFSTGSLKIIFQRI
tara:strand:+ start:1467 stop:1595 length:129 start_codon:yes stop_codon:yes gene_type:complete